MASLRCRDCGRAASTCECRGRRRWQLRAYAGTDDEGHKHWATKTVTAGIRGAEHALNEFAAEVNKRPRSTSRSATVGELFDKWLAQLGAHGRAPATVRDYRSKYHSYIRPRFAEVPVSRLSAADLDALYAYLHATGRAPGTIRKTHAIIRKALDQARRWGWIATNPADDATPPSIRGHRPSPPDPACIPAILAAADTLTPQAQLLIRLALSTGARRGELVALTWGDIDLDAPAVHIRSSLSRDLDGNLIRKPTKTHATAWVLIDAGTATLLERWRATQDTNAALEHVALDGDSFVLTPDLMARRPYGPDWASGIWSNVRGHNGVPDCPLKDLRHLSATYLLGQGVPIAEIAARLRHASPSTTLRFYAGTSPEMQEASRKALGKAFGT